MLSPRPDRHLNEDTSTALPQPASWHPVELSRQTQGPRDWLVQAGEMAERIGALDWASTSTGARENWPQPLRTMVSTILASKIPMLVLWGSELVQIYNDAFRDLGSNQHPQALGRTARGTWPELWAFQEPVYEAVMQRGESRLFEGRLQVRSRVNPHGAYCTISHSPVRLEDGTVGGILVVIQDSTLAWEREQQLQESEQRFRTVVENSLDGINMLDLKTLRYVFLSPAQVAMSGFTLDEVNRFTLEEIIERIHPEDRPSATELFHHLFAAHDERQTPITYRWKIKNGEYRWLADKRKLVRDENGQPVALVGVSRDISEQKRIEEQLRYQASLLDTVADPVISTDALDHIKSWNKAAETLYGYSEREALGRPLNVLLRTDFQAQERSELLRHLEQDGLVRIEVVHHNKQGQPLHIHAHAVVLRDSRGTMCGTLAIFRDITERKQAEQERERLLEDLRVAQKQAATDLDAMTRLHAVSSLYLEPGNLGSLLGEILDAAIALTGAELGTLQIMVPETSSLRLTVQQGFPEGSLDAFEVVQMGEGVCGTALEQKQRVIVEDVGTSPLTQGPLAPNTYRQAGVRAIQSTPLVSRTGKLLGMLSTHWKRPGKPDDRALRLLDLLGRQASDLLERAQAEESLRAANAQLLEADRRKNEFLAVLSHELRNPLAPIKNSLYLLDQAVPGSEQARRAKSVIDRQVGLLVRLVDDLLDITRIARNKVQLRLERLDLNSLVGRTLEDHRTVLDKAGVRLEFEPAPMPVTIEGDSNRMTQVVGNLLQNAAKFTPQGGRVTVGLSADLSTRRAILRVQDTGVGMAPELRARLFEPFMQADTTLDRSQGGLGLGLALVKGIIDLHGGEVDARSEGLGKGSELVVRIPLTLAAVVDPPPNSWRGAKSPRRVLIIEDNIDAADSLRELLELEGHQVEVAHDGPAGIAKARQFQPDIVLCDIGLPGMDGFEVARVFKSDDMLQRGYLVALSGYALPDDLERAAKAGFERHLSKPPNLSKLEHLLEYARSR